MSQNKRYNYNAISTTADGGHVRYCRKQINSNDIRTYNYAKHKYYIYNKHY